jgi:hypothetical protein
MSRVDVMLGGVPIRLHAGLPVQRYAPLGDGPILRRSKGAGVKFSHWTERWAISVSGSGWMGPGLAGLNYRQPLELRCTQQMEVRTTALSTTIPGTVRPDKAPWCLAYTGRDWVPTPVAYNAGTKVATITPLAGALEYQVCWMPVFTVLMGRPERGLDPGANSHDWAFTAEEA